MNAPQHSFDAVARGLTGTLTLALLFGCTAQDDDFGDPEDRWADADDDHSAPEDLVDSEHHQTAQEAQEADVAIAAAELRHPRGRLAGRQLLLHAADRGRRRARGDRADQVGPSRQWYHHVD